MSIASQNERGGAVASLFVRRPVLAVVINALIIVGGLAAFFGVEVRELPNVERPTLTVSTNWDGAAAETVDREITSTIEGVVARVQGVASISSTSSYGQSRVTLTFNDVRACVRDWRAMRDRVEQAIEAFRSNPPPLPVDEIAEANQLLQWLCADNFTFLGLRE